MNKVWARERWKTTLFAEVLNVTNKTNLRYESFNGYNSDKLSYITLNSMFPILPSVGIVLER